MARERGGVIREHCALQGLQPDAEGVEVATAAGRIRAREVVVAMGAWASKLADVLGQPWLARVIQPGKGYSITYSAPPLVPTRPMILHERSVCVTAWGSGFRLGSTMEFSGFDDSLNERRLAALQRGAAEYLHVPEGPELQERWFGWRPMSRDDIPLLGRAPGHRHLWLAVGHGMMGVSMSASTGQLMADLIAGRVPDVNPAPFDPARFA